MLCVLAGIPKAYVERVEVLLRKSLAGCVPLSLPANPDGGGWLQATKQLAENVANRLLDHQAKNDGAFFKGCGVLTFASHGSNADAFFDFLEPVLIARPIWLPMPLRTLGTPGQIAANKAAKDAVLNADVLMNIAKATNREFADRLTRTPLHLPLLNFCSDSYAFTIRNLARTLCTTASPTDAIQAACHQIEASHPFRAQGNRRSFMDSDNKRFVMPGRDLHGQAHRAPPHNAMCVLSSKLRLGGFLPDGFHFDCVKNDNERLEGSFPNCHRADEWHRGNPHVNIGPNDGLRS